MSNLGFGFMINALSGNRGAEFLLKAIGKTIKSVFLDEAADRLKFVFEDDSTLSMYDDGQSCCEHRYMRTDDDLSYFIGAVLWGAEIKDAPSIETDYDCHDVQFLEIQTNKGVFTMSNHNEHNGYYGGFWIRCSN